MNKDEYGINYVFSTGYNLSGFDSLSITFTKPSGDTLTVTNPDVSAPAVELDLPVVGIIPAETYAQYTFVDGDVDEAGVWTARVTYIDPTQKLISDIGDFTVGE